MARQEQWKNDHRFGGKLETLLSKQMRAQYQGGGEKSHGYDRGELSKLQKEKSYGGDLMSQASKEGRVHGAATKWGAGQHGTKYLGKNQGKAVFLGTSEAQKIRNKNNNGTSEEQKIRNKNRTGKDCVCGRPSCTVRAGKGGASAFFKAYLNTSKGQQCAEKILERIKSGAIAKRFKKYLPGFNLAAEKEKALSSSSSSSSSKKNVHLTAKTTRENVIGEFVFQKRFSFSLYHQIIYTHQSYIY